MRNLIKKAKGILVYDFGFLKKRFYYKTKIYLSKYYNTSNNIPLKKGKTIIYMLDGRVYSGGLSDILRGIISMYCLSKEIGFDFMINFSFPYNLEDYLVPNQYNWKINQGEISYNSNYSIPFWMYCSHTNYCRSREFENKFQKKILIDFINNNKLKQQFHIYTNSQFVQGINYSLLFNELFKPSDTLRKILNEHKRKIGKEYISMTFRFQQLLGDFVEKPSNSRTNKLIEKLNISNNLNGLLFTKFGELQLRVLLGDYKDKKISLPLNEVEKEILINKCVHKISELHLNIFTNKKILITSDSNIFLQKIKKLNFVYTIDNMCINIDDKDIRTINQDIFIKPFIDLLLVSEANKIFLLRTESMYKSGFALNSSFIHNKKYEEIFF